MQPRSINEEFVAGWCEELVRGSLPFPAPLVQAWETTLRAAVRSDPLPPRVPVVGRYGTADSYLRGVAAGLAATREGAGDALAGGSEAISFAAGLLAGSAALAAECPDEPRELVMAKAAAGAAVDRAADSGDLTAAIADAATALRHVRPRVGSTFVTAIVLALNRWANPEPPAAVDATRYRVELLLEPVAPATELDRFTIDDVVADLAQRCDWVPRRPGFRLYLSTVQPGPLIEALLPFGLVSELLIEVELP